MFSIRRYIVYLALAAVIVVTYNHLYGTLSPTETISKENLYNPGDEVEDESELHKAPPGFKWSEVTTHFPVPTFHQIPTAKSLVLPKIQHTFTKEKPEQARIRKARLDDVLATFKRGWYAYRKYAWGHDELSPLSASYNDKFGGWQATAIDNLDTLWIMGLKKEFEEAVRSVIKIDLTRVKLDHLNVFETTIRHLGGLLAAYDLSRDKRLLVKAKDFGDMLIKAFDTSNHLPITRWSMEAAMHGIQQDPPDSVLLAEIGSLSMEFTRLSQLTGDPKWFDAVHRITLLFEASLDKSKLPGMFPISIGVKVVDVGSDDSFTLNGMADSFFEYLPKMHLLLGGLEPAYHNLYTHTLNTAAKYTIFRPMTSDNADILFSGVANVNEDGIRLTPQAQHLGCFTGGMYALGGKLFEEPEHFQMGKKLTHGCIWAYKNFPNGVMTETFTAVACKNKESCQWDEKVWRAEIQAELLDETDLDDYIARNHLVEGVTKYNDPKYHLRPEAIESVFLLYRMTGDAALLDTAWDMYKAIIKVSHTDIANAAVDDVVGASAEENKQFDSMESFWLAETMKYFYLIFSEPTVISLDEWVFNTEAHPFRRPVN